MTGKRKETKQRRTGEFTGTKKKAKLLSLLTLKLKKVTNTVLPV